MDLLVFAPDWGKKGGARLSPGPSSALWGFLQHVSIRTLVYSQLPVNGGVKTGHVAA
jgi:hypothetical protein